MLVVIYAMRNTTVRITSARKGSRVEVREYEQNTVDV